MASSSVILGKNKVTNQVHFCASMIPTIIFISIMCQCLAQKSWWQTGQFYQIYPRSFKDSNGDGIGDLNGIIEKLDYIKEIGITAAWLSPIFKSPMVDFGYDISDYYSIQPEYGTMNDFDRLLAKAKQLGIKIILDFVPNHTSDQHEWFQRSVAKESGFENFYIWHPGKIDRNNSTNRLPPSNWVSAFRGSAWQWHSIRREFYLHQYAIQQPDLNYRNPRVFDEMLKILQFWLDKGVAGFRGDAVPRIFEVPSDENGDYPDEPLSGLTDDPDAKNYVTRIYTRDLPETFDFIYKIRQFMNQYQRENGGQDTLVFLTESYSPINVLMKYYGNETHPGAHLPMNFNLITKLNNSSSASDFVRIIDLWIKNLPNGCTANWVLGNHDRRRVASRFGSKRIDQLNMLVMILPGASVTYNGEEIGMEDVYISWEETKDPAACNSNPTVFEKFTRDPARTPFQWNDSKNAGFSTSEKTWLPVAKNYKEINVAKQLKANRSHLKVFKELTVLRKSAILHNGALNYKALNENILVVERTLSSSQRIVLVMNLANVRGIVDLFHSFERLSLKLRCKIVNVDSQHNPGDKVDGNIVILDGYESLVLETFDEIDHSEF